MDPTTLINVEASLIAVLAGLLFALVGWVGSRIIAKQDETLARLDDVKDDMIARINNIDVRVAKVEYKIGIYE